MGRTNNTALRGTRLGPTDPAMLSDPLAHLHEDHLREREICAVIDRVAAADVPAVADVDDVLGFLTVELPLHLRDEEEELFPMMRRRCLEEDEIETVLTRLLADHRHAGEDTPAVTQILMRVQDKGGSLSATDRTALTSYASHARAHLILENAILLPFAKLRLTKKDLGTMQVNMERRRGIGPDREAPHAV